MTGTVCISSKLPRVNDRTVLVTTVRRPTKIDDLDTRAPGDHISPHLWMLHLPHIRPHQQDVLWLEVGVGVVLRMHKTDGLEELPCKGLHLCDRETLVPVLLDDVIEGLAQRLEDDAVVLVVVKVLVVADYVVLVLRVRPVQLLHYALLDPC